VGIRHQSWAKAKADAPVAAKLWQKTIGYEWQEEKDPKTDDDLSWLDGAITEHPPLTEEQRRKREADDLEHEREAAMAGGGAEALLEIKRRAEELKSAAFPSTFCR
jgi:hypothetical protein